MKKLKNILLIVAFQFATGITFGQENILLITPADGDTIYTKHPLLTWSYMSGFSVTNNREYYRLILVDLKENQSAAAGVIVNSPLIKMDHLVGTQMFYPYDAPALIDGHRYGWQIFKIFNNVIVDKSEAFLFILPLLVEPSPQYYKMKVKNDGTIYQAIGTKLCFEFVEAHQSNELTYYVYDANNELVSSTLKQDKEEERIEQKELKHIGSNFYEIDLGKSAKPGIYRVMVLDARKQRYELKYEVK